MGSKCGIIKVVSRREGNNFNDATFAAHVDDATFAAHVDAFKRPV